MKIEVNHNGHHIRYDEDTNTWRCDHMRLQESSLAKLRTKLNEEDRDTRRIDNIRAFHIGSSDAEEIVITMIDTGRHGVTGFRVGANTKKRDYFSLGSLVVHNPENDAKIERYLKARTDRDTAQAALDMARKALPHPTAEQLTQLSKARTK